MNETTITRRWEQALELAEQLGYTLDREAHEFVLIKPFRSVERFETVEGVYGFLKGLSQ